MLNINQDRTDNKLVVTLEGRIDSITSSELEEALMAALEGTEELVMDFCGVDYVSSAGLRVLLAAQKIMNKQGCMKLKNVCKAIMDIFEVTGFAEILTIEEQCEEEEPGETAGDEEPESEEEK